MEHSLYLMKESMQENGEYNGQGTYTWSNGDKYVGEWKDGKENGQGTITKTYRDGKFIYVGEWKDAKKHGQGTMTYPGGEKCEGEWVKGGFRNGKCYDKDGTIQYIYINGVKQK